MLAHFIVSDDVERSQRFYTEVLGGEVAFAGGPINVALANSYVVINGGGGPTDDKPAVTLETPRDPDRVSSFPEYSRRRHSGHIHRVERQRCSVSDATKAAPVRDSVLHPRSRRSSDRSRANHRSKGRLAARSLAKRLALSLTARASLHLIRVATHRLRQPRRSPTASQSPSSRAKERAGGLYACDRRAARTPSRSPRA